MDDRKLAWGADEPKVSCATFCRFTCLCVASTARSTAARLSSSRTSSSCEMLPASAALLQGTVLSVCSSLAQLVADARVCISGVRILRVT